MRSMRWKAVAIAAASVVLLALGAAPASAALPTYEGDMTFPAIEGPLGPEEFSWEVKLREGQELESINEQYAGIYFTESDVLNVLISAEHAHDATGAPVPTSLAVTQPNIVTLIVHHREGNPLNGGLPFAYPVTAGAGWILRIEEGTIVQGPMDEQELREAQERVERANPAAEPELSNIQLRRCMVPRLKGRSLQTARDRLRQADCRIGKVTKRHGATYKNGKIVKQDPGPGTSAQPGKTVNVTLGRRPRSR